MGAPQENPPCPTLYVTNLGPTCTEDELTQILSRFSPSLSLTLDPSLYLCVRALFFN